MIYRQLLLSSLTQEVSSLLSHKHPSLYGRSLLLLITWFIGFNWENNWGLTTSLPLFGSQLSTLSTETCMRVTTTLSSRCCNWSQSSNMAMSGKISNFFFRASETALPRRAASLSLLTTWNRLLITWNRFDPGSYEKIFENIFEVPWDLFGVVRGSNLTLLHGRISPTGDFNHLWYEVLHHGSRFSGLKLVT